MHRRSRSSVLALTLLAAAVVPSAFAKSAGPKIHTVTLGPMRKVPFTPAYASADTRDEASTTLRVRALFVDERQKEWTVGELHNVTDRSFAIRRALHVNDALPNDPGERWTWQPGPWILVDRVTGHVTPLHLPDFDPAVSDAVWFRDYAAYCGIATPTSRSAKSDPAPATLVAVVAQASARKAVAQRPIGRWPAPDHPADGHPADGHLATACKPATWQRLPMRATLTPTTGDPVTFDVVGSTALIEEGDNDD